MINNYIQKECSDKSNIAKCAKQRATRPRHTQTQQNQRQKHPPSDRLPALPTDARPAQHPVGSAPEIIDAHGLELDLALPGVAAIAGDEQALPLGSLTASEKASLSVIEVGATSPRTGARHLRPAASLTVAVSIAVAVAVIVVVTVVAVVVAVAAVAVVVDDVVGFGGAAVVVDIAGVVATVRICVVTA